MDSIRVVLFLSWIAFSVVMVFVQPILGAVLLFAALAPFFGDYQT